MSSVALCIAVAAEHFEVTRRDLISHRRDRTTAFARHVAIWLAKRTTTLTLPQIGAVFDRDHTTIQHAIRLVDDRRAEDPELRQQLAALVIAVEASVMATTTLGLAQRLPAPIDAVAVAERVLRTERAATRVSVDELRALADAVAADAIDVRREHALTLARDFVEARRALRAPFTSASTRTAAIRVSQDAFAALEAAIDEIENSPEPLSPEPDLEVHHERRAGIAAGRG